MSELVDDMARALAAAMLTAAWRRTPTPEEVAETDLSSLHIDEFLDPCALALLATRAVLVAQAEWARTASPSDVGDPDFFEEGLRGFARAHGLEIGKDDD